MTFGDPGGANDPGKSFDAFKGKDLWTTGPNSYKNAREYFSDDTFHVRAVGYISSLKESNGKNKMDVWGVDHNKNITHSQLGY